MAGNNHMSIRQVELNGINPGLKRMLKGTIAIQREALAYLCGVSMDHWDTLGPLSRQKRLTMMEKLVHKTKDNPSPEYADFDTKFPKLPSYIRRALINAATGAASSFHTRLADYGRRKYAAMSDGKRFREKPPVFSPSNACIVLYKKQSFDRDGRSVTIKAFIRNSWQWVRVSMPSRDYKDLEKTALAAVRVFSPSLVYKNRKFYLAFPVDYGCAGFPERDIRHQKVLAADLGINRGAVFSVVDSRGNIHARMFDPFGRERAALESCIKAIRHVQKKSGHGQSLSKVYQKLDGLKDNYAKQLAHWIVMQAVQQGVYGIVLEYLGRMKGRGSKKDRIHHWCKCRILDYVKGLAFRYGIRVFLINPKNTSRLAYDGSGEVVRDNNNFSLCTFATGKRYDCDLGASYNIGARYFLRAMEKAMASEPWERLKAEVPGLATRTECTLFTLWKVSALLYGEDMSRRKAAA